MAESEGTVSGDPLAVERASSPFGRGPDPDTTTPAAVCRFLAVRGPDGALNPASSRVDTAHRCIAIGDPVPQSARQQELVCLVAAHVNCPRFLRGVILAGTPPPPPRREPIAPAVIGASLVLAAALAASFGFLAVRGGFNIPVASPSPVAVAAVDGPSSVPVPSASTTPVEPPSAVPMSTTVPAASATASPTPVPTASPSPTPLPTPIATPTPAPPRPTSTPTPTATSDRFAVLTKCPSTPDCWIYVIRAGDNLRSIANWFGVSYDRILQMNSWITDPTTIHAGQHLRIPTPTR